MENWGGTDLHCVIMCLLFTLDTPNSSIRVHWRVHLGSCHYLENVQRLLFIMKEFFSLSLTVIAKNGICYIDSVELLPVFAYCHAVEFRTTWDAEELQPRVWVSGSPVWDLKGFLLEHYNDLELSMFMENPGYLSHHRSLCAFYFLKLDLFFIKITLL